MSKSWIALFLGVLLWSAIQPYDYVIWLLEVLPALIGFLVMICTRRVFPLTSLAYWLILLECVILMIGGHYTYARVPVFDWLSDYFDHGRNNYDKLAHFFQGFVPAIVAREILLRLRVVRGRGWMFFLVCCVCLSISAFYELLEWWVALAAEATEQDFIGTQGYVWDTQSDMALALVGAIVAQVVLEPWHARQLALLNAPGHIPGLRVKAGSGSCTE